MKLASLKYLNLSPEEFKDIAKLVAQKIMKIMKT